VKFGFGHKWIVGVVDLGSNRNPGVVKFGLFHKRVVDVVVLLAVGLDFGPNRNHPAVVVVMKVAGLGLRGVLVVDLDFDPNRNLLADEATVDWKYWALTDYPMLN